MLPRSPTSKSTLPVRCDRRPIGQSVLVSGTYTNNFSFSFCFFNNLKIVPGLTMCGALSDESGVCGLQLLLDFASAVILGSKSSGTRDRIFTILIVIPTHPGGSGSCIYFPQEQGGSVITPAIGLYAYVCT
jgi:hypothetical protein